MAIRVLQFKQEFNGESAVDWVEITSQDGISETGEPTSSTWLRVSDISHPKKLAGFKHDALVWQWAQIAPAYEAWKSGNAIPEKGIPLGAWAGVSASQAAALKAVGIRTVEDMAEASDDRLSRPVVPDMRALKKQAAEYLASRGDVALVGKVADLEARLEAAMQLLEAQTNPDEGEKRGRGRPRKEEAA